MLKRYRMSSLADKQNAKAGAGPEIKPAEAAVKKSAKPKKVEKPKKVGKSKKLKSKKRK